MAERANTTRRTFLKGGVVLAAAAHTVALAPGMSDDILELGKQFEKSWAAEKAFYASHDLADPANDAGFDEVYFRTQNLVDLIEKAEATTLEGLRVKARAVQWCYGDDPMKLDGDTTDMRISSQILNGILTI